MDKLRVALIGLGARGTVLLSTICACEGVELVALCDVREKVLNKGFEIVKEKTGKEPKRYFDYLDIIKDGGVDAVIVATAWDSHVKISVDFMQAGIAVGCEVFGAYDIEDCWQLVRTYEQRALGHGGMDYFLLKAFFDAVKNGEEMPIDVYDAATWMAITPLSEQSVAMGGAPQPIPDFTRGAYIRRPLKDVVQLPNPSKNK